MRNHNYHKFTFTSRLRFESRKSGMLTTDSIRRPFTHRWFILGPAVESREYQESLLSSLCFSSALSSGSSETIVWMSKNELCYWLFNSKKQLADWFFCGKIHNVIRLIFDADNKSFSKADGIANFKVWHFKDLNFKFKHLNRGNSFKLTHCCSSVHLFRILTKWDSLRKKAM